jgi:hypothetical protein
MNSKKRTVIFLFIVFCIPVLLYLQTVSFGFIYFDDDRLILNNYAFLSHFGNIGGAFQTDAFITGTSYFFRPLQVVSYMVDIQLSGGNHPWMFHLTNVLLFGLVSCLIYLLFIRFSISPDIALPATLVYCLHPLFISSVAWIPARGDLLLSVFSLLSFLALIEYLQKNARGYAVLHWATFTIALFCKETAAFLPFLYILYFFIYTSTRPEKKHFIILLSWAVSGIGWFYLRSNAIGDFSGRHEVAQMLGENDMVGLSPVLSNIRTIPESLCKFFVPVDTAPIPGFSAIKTIAGLAILVVLVVFLFTGKTRKERLFGLCWFFLLIIPTLLFKHKIIDYLDHRFFLPLLGIMLYILKAIPTKQREPVKIKVSWIPVAMVIILSTVTFANTRVYKEPMAFYNSAIGKNPRCAIAYINRGATYQNKGLTDKAIEDYSKAIQLKPGFSGTFKNRANAWFSLQKYDNAIADYSRVIELGTRDPGTYNNRGVTWIRKGMNNKACDDFQMAAQLGSKAAPGNLQRFCMKQPSFHK